MSLLLDLLLLCTSWTHVLLAPYTKVEESFNLHAAHDVLFYGLSPEGIQKYDHLVFPGAVPRTFIGAIALAYVSKPFLFLGQHFGRVQSKADVQILLRLILTTLTTLSLIFIQHRVTRRFGRLTGLFYTLLSITQFHLPFWMGRTLPNMFALIPVNITTALLLPTTPSSPSLRISPSRSRLILSLLTFSAIVFRSELLLYLAPVTLSILLSGSLPFWSVVKTGFISGLGSIALSTLIDTYLWSTPSPLLPELYSIYFNVILGHSSSWGVSPPHYYLSNSLPKLLLSAFPLSLFALFFSGPSNRRRLIGVVAPATIFVGLISGLKHKEWRFIIYVVPIYNVAAAQALTFLSTRRRTTFFGTLAFLAVPACLLGNLVVTGMLTGASVGNYPGGEALATFNQLYRNHTNVHVHISNLAAQTGASLFLQENSPLYISSLSLSRLLSAPAPDSPTGSPGWVYDKTENLALQELTSNTTFTHLISEISPQEVGLLPESHQAWRLVRSIDAFQGFGFGGAGGFGGVRAWVREVVKERKLAALGELGEVVRVRKGEALWIYERT